MRFRQLASSAQRLAGVDFPFGQRYIVVNIPSAAVDAVENDRVVRRYTAIVGDVEHPSPEVQAKIGAVNINPTWTVPISIIKNEIAPKMQKDPSYLAARAFACSTIAARRSIRDRSIGPVSGRPITRCGRTPARRIRSARSASPCPISMRSICMTRRRKRLFASDYRFLSHGCVRVQGVVRSRRLAARGRQRAADRPMGQSRDHGQDRRRRARRT